MNQPMDATEIGELLAKHAAPLELFASQWTASAEDCVQDAFVELATQANPPPNPAAWLYRVVRNRAHNASRADRRRANHERLASMLGHSIARPAETGLDNEELQTSLDTLSGADRELVVLRIWSGLTWQEIAELTDSSSSSVQRRYVVVLKKLKQILEPACTSPLKFRPT